MQRLYSAAISAVSYKTIDQFDCRNLKSYKCSDMKSIKKVCEYNLFFL